LQLGLGADGGGVFNISGGTLSLNLGSNMIMGDNGNTSTGLAGGGNSAVSTVYQSAGNVTFSGTTAGLAETNGMGPNNSGALVFGNTRTTGRTQPAAGIYTYVLAGTGTLTVPQIRTNATPAPTSNLYFNGGTLKPTTSNAATGNAATTTFLGGSTYVL